MSSNLNKLELQEKIAMLEKNFADGDSSALETIREWREQIAILIAKSDYAELDTTKQIAKRLREVIQNINKRLINEKEMEQRTRDRLFEQKEATAYYLSLIDNRFDEALRGIADKVNYELGSQEK